MRVCPNVQLFVQAGRGSVSVVHQEIKRGIPIDTEILARHTAGTFDVYTPSMKSFSGRVIRGSQRAASLGYPTINIVVNHMSIDGIFAAKVRIDGIDRLAAAFADPLRGILEAHILDCDEDLYNREATITLHKKLRRNRRFETDDALRVAIASDVEAVRAYFTHV